MSSASFDEPGAVAAGEAGVVGEASFEGRQSGGCGAEGARDDSERELLVLAEGSQLGAGGQVVGRVGERLVDLAGDEAFEAADDLLAGLALGAATGDVGAGGGI